MAHASQGELAAVGTFDARLQRIAEEEAARARRDSRAAGVAVVILDARQGALLAMGAFHATPVALAAAYGRLAHDGLYPSAMRTSTTEAPGRVIGSATARTGRSLLEQAVYGEGATGRLAQVPVLASPARPALENGEEWMLRRPCAYRESKSCAPWSGAGVWAARGLGETSWTPVPALWTERSDAVWALSDQAMLR